MLVFPERFNKNAATVQGMASQAETGMWLIEYMCQRVGVAGLAALDVLDFGCGCRFADAFVNLGVPIGSYFGVDVDRGMVDWLSREIEHPRLGFAWWDAQNPLYHPTGQPLSAFAALPVDGRSFDLICMFSVITHQLPEDAEAIFRLLRGCIRPTGHLFFSARLEKAANGYRELVPETPTAFSAYSQDLLSELLARTGWKILSIAEREPSRAQGVVPIQDSILCEPA